MVACQGKHRKGWDEKRKVCDGLRGLWMRFWMRFWRRKGDMQIWGGLLLSVGTVGPGGMVEVAFGVQSMFGLLRLCCGLHRTCTVLSFQNFTNEIH